MAVEAFTPILIGVNYTICMRYIFTIPDRVVAGQQHETCADTDGKSL